MIQKCHICRFPRQCVKIDKVRKCQSCLTAEDKQWLYAKKREKAQNYKKIDRIRKPTGEWELFVKIWLKRPHECTGCEAKLYVMKAENFSHTIRKGEDESLRLEEQNIEIECMDCHQIWDTGTWDKIIKQRNFVKRMKNIKSVRADLYARKVLKIQEFTGVDSGI